MMSPYSFDNRPIYDRIAATQRWRGSEARCARRRGWRRTMPQSWRPWGRRERRAGGEDGGGGGGSAGSKDTLAGWLDEYDREKHVGTFAAPTHQGPSVPSPVKPPPPTARSRLRIKRRKAWDHPRAQVFSLHVLPRRLGPRVRGAALAHDHVQHVWRTRASECRTRECAPAPSRVNTRLLPSAARAHHVAARGRTRRKRSCATRAQSARARRALNSVAHHLRPVQAATGRAASTGCAALGGGAAHAGGTASAGCAKSSDPKPFVRAAGGGGGGDGVSCSSGSGRAGGASGLVGEGVPGAAASTAACPPAAAASTASDKRPSCAAASSAWPSALSR